MSVLTTQTFEGARSRNTLTAPNCTNETISDSDTVYTKIIQALAIKFTDSTEEAEVAAREMFDDIYRYSARGLNVRLDEQQLVARIALRRLIKYLN